MKPIILAAALVTMTLPASADTIRDRTGRVTGTVQQTAPDSFMVRDRQGRATAWVDCSGSSCLARDPRSGKALGTITRQSTREARRK